MFEILTSQFLSIATGLISSYLFLIYFLRKKRAQISISPHISKRELDGQINYFFKFVNKTRAEIFDVRVEPTFYKQVGGIGGLNIQGKDIKLVQDFISYIPEGKSADPNSLHAWRVRTTQDLEEEWQDESTYIRLTIIAKHSLSGFSSIFVQEFHSKASITSKQFVTGDSLEVR
ncbi:hypothetical protein [Flavobacterium sp.]|uniref:hypothetical protein n=1 Tax=Flavobacterium sp. TaxID=239 RepID=UPI0026293B53|nr:hypothetical protein [Flavobacterium sp.]